MYRNNICKHVFVYVNMIVLALGGKVPALPAPGIDRGTSCIPGKSFYCYTTGSGYKFYMNFITTHHRSMKIDDRSGPYGRVFESRGVTQVERGIGDVPQNRVPFSPLW